MTPEEQLRIVKIVNNGCLRLEKVEELVIGLARM
jgi:hypothetical protein